VAGIRGEVATCLGRVRQEDGLRHLAVDASPVSGTDMEARCWIPGEASRLEAEAIGRAVMALVPDFTSVLVGHTGMLHCDTSLLMETMVPQSGQRYRDLCLLMVPLGPRTYLIETHMAREA
jgi:hypothetical protein